MSELYVRPELLAALPGVPPVIAKFSLLTAEHGGLTVGRWLSQLAIEDLDTVLMLIGEARYSEAALLPWTLVAVLLANGEGLPVAQEMDLGRLVRKLVWLVQVEMLHRDGHVELDLERVRLETFELSQVRATRAPNSPANGPIPLLKIRTVPLKS